MLHVTNGDHAGDKIRATGLAGHVLPWRDVLHEGPVPGGLDLTALSEARARFIAERGWGKLDDVRREFVERDTILGAFRRHGDVVLWFEHDLYDQLQLLQVLDWFAERDLGAASLDLICVPDYLGPMAPERLRALFAERAPVAPAQLTLARDAWAAFRSSTPTGLTAIVTGDTAALPFLAPALRRHLEEFPSVATGLSRSETQALEAIAAGRTHLQETFVAAHREREDPIFVGDSVFASYLERLSAGPEPLVLFDDNSRILAPREPGTGFWNRRVALTDAGRDVLAGRRDWMALGAPERWLGGVRLHGPAVRWRWSPAADRLVDRGRPGGD